MALPGRGSPHSPGDDATGDGRGRALCVDERGSASLIVAAAIGLALILAALTADLAVVATSRVRAQTAADAAALAAAQELVTPSELGPEGAAREYARRHGATVVDCQCEMGSTDVVVSVQVPVSMLFTGRHAAVGAIARAVVLPSGMAGLHPAFASRLDCLFQRVPGLWIVSGFRTRDEQADLYRQKPELAAPPGLSMHERGMAADLGFPSAAHRERAHTESNRCGLAFPVPEEPWHIEPALRSGSPF